MQRISTTLSYGVLAVSAVLGVNAQAGAGEPFAPHFTGHWPHAVVPVGFGGYYDYYGGGGTTYAESVLRGEAALMQAYGEYEVNSAEALCSFEAAVDLALDNKVKALEVRQERAVMARIHRAEERRNKLARRAELRSARQTARAQTEAAMSPAEQAAKQEHLAAGKLELARKLEQRGRVEAAQRWMEEIVQEYPGTAAAREVSMMIAGQ